MSSTYLAQSAHTLALFAEDAHHKDTLRTLHATEVDIGGEALEQGWQRAYRLLSGIDHTLHLAKQGAQVLELTASAAAHVESLLQRIYDVAPDAFGMISQLRAMQKVLDAMCAKELHQLGGLCTDTSTQREYQHQWFGDTSTQPSTIITMVGGVGSQTPRGHLHHMERSARVHQETGAHVVAWEYTAPASIPGGVASHAARAAGQELAEHQAQLRAQYPDARLIIVAHSYGTVVTGHAAAEADAVMLLGSPGVPVRSFAPNTKVVSVLNHADPIGLTGNVTTALHGHDPHAPGYPAGQLYRPGDHSSYFEDPEVYEQLRQLSSG